MKYLLSLLLAGSCGLAWAQTNAPERQLDITSDSGHFDGKSSKMIYLGHVVVTDKARATMHCGQLTVDVPMSGGDPTNILAEIDVVVDVLDEKGQTNHVTADKAIYAYSVANTVTNRTLTFTGGKPMPKVVNPQFTATGEPLVYDFVSKQFGGEHYHMEFNIKSTGTNGTPFNLLK